MTTLLLAPEYWSDGSDLPTGSTTIVASCGHRCWIAPSALPHVLSGRLEPVCRDCAPPAKSLSTVLGADAELAQTLGPELAATVREALRRNNKNS